MRIWIDLSNSPHPLLFEPVARRLQELGHDVGVTARDNAQTLALTLERWPDAAIIGGESPKARARKLETLVARIPMLRRWARSFGPDVALSHNSYAQIVAARVLGVPVVTAMDYEGQPANHLAFRLADTILMPDALRGSRVSGQGASSGRARFYPGFKEEVYLGEFTPNPDLLPTLGLSRGGGPVVVARTPPGRALYHHFGNQLFSDAIEVLGREPGVHVIALVRHAEQRSALRALGLRNLLVPEEAVDSRALLYEADLVLGAGGTMTREAALMGIPTYSVFAGRPAAVDRELERERRLKRLESAGELVPLRARASSPTPLATLRSRASVLVESFVEAPLALASV